MGNERYFFVPVVFLIFLCACVLQNESIKGAENLDNLNRNALEEQRKQMGLSEEIFSNLPQAPHDFNEVMDAYFSGKFSDETFFSQKYYLQPEFYPSFLEHGAPYWRSAFATHWGAYGFGSFPTRKEIKMRKAQETQTKFFVHSGYGVRSYQGMGISTVYENGSEEFLEADINERYFLLGPNFPKFEKNWAREIVVKLKSSDNIPQGEYKIRFELSNPPQEFSEKWGKETQRAGKPYFGTSPISSSAPLYELRVVIE